MEITLHSKFLTGWGIEMKHVMYTTGKMNFVHTHGKNNGVGKSACVCVWNDELMAYIRKDCREYAAFALRKLRKNGVSIERKVMTK